MEIEEERAVELYDFLYRDSNRLTSYYSQIFQGKLTSFEELESDSDAQDRELKGDVKIASLSAKTTSTKQSSARRIFDPHDMHIADVLTFLDDNEYINKNYADTPNGSLFLAKGKVFFVDSQLIKSTSSIFSLMTSRGIIPVDDPNIAIGVEALNNMLDGVPFPPIYFLETNDGDIVSGIVKDTGMEEIVSTYYLRYGQNALPDVYLLGLKEMSEPLAESSASGFLKAAQAVTTMISDLLLPALSIKATPLVMYRKFGV